MFLFPPDENSPRKMYIISDYRRFKMKNRLER